MPEINAIHIAIISVLAVVGAVLGWTLRSKRASAEKSVVNVGWQEQLNAQRLEHDRLTEQNKTLMEQVSQYLAASNDAKSRMTDQAKAHQEACKRRDQLQAQIADVRNTLEAAISERDLLKSNADSQASTAREVAAKDARIEKLQESLDSWQSRLPPLIEKYASKSKDAEQLEADLESARARIAQLEAERDMGQTRIEPVSDPEELTDGLMASNEVIEEDEDAADDEALESLDVDEDEAEDADEDETEDTDNDSDEDNAEDDDDDSDEDEAEDTDNDSDEDENEDTDDNADEDAGEDTVDEGGEDEIEDADDDSKPQKAGIDFIDHDRIGTLQVDFKDLIASEAILEPDDDTDGDEESDSVDDSDLDGATEVDDIDQTDDSSLAAVLDDLDDEPDDEDIDQPQVPDDDEEPDGDEDTADDSDEDSENESASSDTSARDNLKQIKGIGPAIEKTLNELGILRFQQIADMSEYEIDRIANRLKGFRSRIYRENWIGQARELLDQDTGD